MRKIIILLLLLPGFVVNAQRWMWANLNKSPKLAKIWGMDTQSGNGARTHSLTSVPSGAFLVITTMSEDETGDATVSSSPVLTWTKRKDAQATHSGNAEIWTATFTAGGNITITSNFGATSNQSSVAWIITGQESSFGGATAVATAQGTPSRTITTTRANSILICVSSDWNAVNGTTPVMRTYRDSATEILYYFVSGGGTGYHYYKLAETVTTYTEGLNGPSGQSAGTCIIEIRSP